MKKYEKPIVMINEDLAEGVYAFSGAVYSDCWETTIADNQVSVSSRGDFRFTVTGAHDGGAYHYAYVVMTATFDQPVKSAEYCGYPLITSIGSEGVYEVKFHLNNYGTGVNATENFGGGALVVETVDSSLTTLTLQSAVIADSGAQ